MTTPALLSLTSYHYRRGGSEIVYFEHEAMFRELGWATAHMARMSSWVITTLATNLQYLSSMRKEAR